MSKRGRPHVEQMMSREQAAERLQVSTRTIDRWIERGRRTDGREGLWPAYRLGRSVVRIPTRVIQDRLDMSLA